MNLLAIDTSGHEGTLALQSDGKLIGEKSLSKTGRRHAQTLVAELDVLIRESGLDYADLDAVAVSIGPGSFTGLRVGVACAKTLAWATGCQIVAVDTLRVIAQNAPAEVAEVSVVSDAYRGDLFAGKYVRNEEGLFVRIGEIEIVDAATWSQQCQPGSIITGLGLLKYATEFDETVQLLGPECWTSLATHVALLGEQQLAAGDTADMWSLEPRYIRRSAAEEKRDATVEQKTGS